MRTIRIGAGAGFSGDRIEPAVELARHGKLDFLVFECLAERTVALAQLRKLQGMEGYDPLLMERMRAVLPICTQNGTKIITNMGAASPQAAAKAVVALARELGLAGLKIACVSGDDVLGMVDRLIPFEDEPLPQRERIISANAYLGVKGILDALDQKADVVITGRVADPALFLAPIAHAFQWSHDDWPRLGKGIAVGHLLECAGQLTGGYFADPPYKVVPFLEDIGFPLAEVREDGTAVFSKLPETGGLLNLQTCREQLLYEVGDPSAYVTPDVVADFSVIELTQLGEDVVEMREASGRERPGLLKVSVGVHNGYVGEGQISYGGGGALARAQLAADVMRRRLDRLGITHARFDLIGVNSLHGDAAAWRCEPYEVRLRVAAHCEASEMAKMIPREMESLYVNGPAGGSGITAQVKESIAIVPALLKGDLVHPVVHVEMS